MVYNPAFMRILRYILVLASILLLQPAYAQFYVTGDDPGKARWNSIETENFKVIFPEGTDSLARIYARKIEQYRIPVSLTSGYVSGEGKGKKMPVVIHAYNAANGSVAWAPKRMDLFSIPSAYDPEPMPWNTMLSVHESRHVTQMQFGLTERLKPGNWFFGEMWNILVSLIYPGISNMEGDAVITETAWTPSGRGRTADFLNYYWVAFDNGDFRNWHDWRFVSQKYNAPDHYSLGYLTIGGFRYLYDCPEFMSTGYHIAAKKPSNLAAFYTAARKLTGKKFNDAFMEVCDTMYSLWKADAEIRKPYIKSEPVTAEPRLYTDYTNNLIVGNDLYALRKGHLDIPTLIRIDSTGKEHRISTFAYQTSKPEWSSEMNRIYWSETRADERWNLKTESRIRYMKAGSKKKHTLRSPGLLHNPAPSAGVVATVKYETGGRSYLDIIDGKTGKLIKSFAAPDSLQLVQAAWVGNDTYATAISDNGYGIYMLPLNEKNEAEGKWKVMLSPQPVKIKDFVSYGNELMFTCDRTGVNELYHFDPSAGKLIQKTSLRYGGEDFRYSGDGKWLYYSSQTVKGMRIFRTLSDSLMNRTADFTELHHYPIAEKVTAQEKAIAKSRGISENINIEISEPKRYRKLPHMFNVHSWAPVYLSVNNIMNMSYDQFWQAASLGATGIIQNRLSTMRGEFGYSAHRDPFNNAVWRHSGHVKFTYSGLYPVIEATFDINDRAARQYSTCAYLLQENRAAMEISSEELATPYIEGSVSAYIPFKFSGGGWFKGITPRITYRIGNDMFNTSMAIMKVEDRFTTGEDGLPLKYQSPVFIGSKDGENRFRHSISGSLNAYVLQNTPSSAVYPRWGFGAEIGIKENIESMDYLSPMGYIYIYGYAPGFIREQGLRLSMMNQMKLDENAVFGQAIVNVLPRGLSSNASLTSWISIRNSLITKLSADYAIPIFIGDLSLGGTMFSIKRLVLTPHFDFSFFSGKNLWSAGAELILDLHSILTLEWPCSFGVTFSYNGGSAFTETASTSGIAIDRYYIGPTFNVTF